MAVSSTIYLQIRTATKNMTATNTSTAAASDRELVITRVFDAPREMVFQAWSKAENLVRWFGPSEFTLPFCEIDFRVGGSYRFCMRSPSGEKHWVSGEYREITEPSRLVFSWNREDAAGEIWTRTIVDLTFVQRGRGTELTLRQGMFETGPFCEEHGFGWNQSLDRLAAFVIEIL
ncbi:MAG TPA: SRPBCC domain-containing protein [Pyrinomonadaceae bacterium]|nr:SRPBCC domain-containing protein [Pyrinomonadaceae bacterium]